MCGRFTNKLTWDEIVRLYRLTIKAPPHNLQPRYNICPTDPVDVVIEHEGNRDFTRMRWRIVPHWWSKPLKELRPATFNARVETGAEKPFFREPFKHQRCLIPASGYHEWAGHRDRQTALVLHCTRRLARPHDRRPVGPLARQIDRRDDYVVRNDHLRTEQVRCRGSRPHAGIARRARL